MRGRVFLCVLLLVALVGVVGADTLILYAVHDGYVYEDTPNDVWFNLSRNVGDANSDNATTNYASVVGTSTDGIFNYNSRTVEVFDSSILGASTTVNSAILSIKVSGRAQAFGTCNLSLIDGYPANPLNLANGDYDGTTFTRQASDILYASVSTANYNNMTLTNLSQVSKTGLTQFMLAHSCDVGNTSITWVTGSSYSGYAIKGATVAGSEPILTIDYTPPDTTPPASITNLANVTTCNSINWTWTDSISNDADVVQIWQNGTFLHNVSANQTYDLWEDLAELTEYTFSSHTCDLTGNCNTTTWVNLSSTTNACGMAPVADFVANDTTVCVDTDTVAFTDLSSNTPTAWHWIITPGGWDSHDQNTTHIFDAEGSYTINLTASNDYGNDTESKVNYITVVNCTSPPPTPVPDSTDWCNTQEIFFWNKVSDLPAYSLMDHYPQIAGETSINVTVSSATGSQQIGAFILPIDALDGIDTLAPGLWRFRGYYSVSSAVGNTTIEYTVFNRSVAGVETDLFYGQAISTDYNSLAVGESLLSYARRNYTYFNPGDRLVVKVNASTTSVADRTLYMYLDGNLHASMLQVSRFVCDDTSGTSGGSGATSDSGMTMMVPLALTSAAFAIATVGLVINRRRKDDEY